MKMSKNLFSLILLLCLMMPLIVFAEESQDGEEDSEAVIDAQSKAIEVALRSLKRWNKIIELQNYIAETNAIIWLQNFRSEESEDEE